MVAEMLKILKHVDLLEKVIWTGVQLSSPPLFSTIAINNIMALQTLSYLKSRFEKGDFPDENDFKDLLDSCFNYSLSDSQEYITFLSTVTADWQLTSDIVDANRYNWTEAYFTSLQYKAASGSFATNNFVRSNFLPTTGGTVSNNLNVQGTILSGGQNIYNLFLNPIDGYQSLNYNPNTYNISITNSSSIVNLSALRSTQQLYFTHLPFTPQNNKTYIFGQLTIPPLTAVNFSNCYRVFNRGLIRSAVLQNSYIPGSTEPSTFYLVNRTQGLTAQLVSGIRYSDTLAEEVTNLTNTLNIDPGGEWSRFGVTFAGDGATFSDQNSNLITDQLLNSTTFVQLSVYAVGNGVGGQSANVRLLYSNNNASYFPIPGTSVRTAIAFTDTLLNWGSITIPGGISSTFTLKFETDQPVLLKNLNVIGYFPVDTRLEVISLTNPMSVFPGDLLDVRQVTPTYATPPQNVVNGLNALLDVTG